MKKNLKAVLFCFAFTTATFFMSCSNAIPEENQPVEKSECETDFLEWDVDSGRCCFGGHRGQNGGNSISGD